MTFVNRHLGCKRTILIMAFILLPASAFADPGLPSSESDSQVKRNPRAQGSDNSLLDGEFKDSGVPNSIQELKSKNSYLHGKADFSIRKDGQMPPLAPPYSRNSSMPQGYNQPPNSFANPYYGRGPAGQNYGNNFENSRPTPFNRGVSDRRNEMEGRVSRFPFSLGARKETVIKDKPSWLPAHAYSNSNMVAPYHNSSLMWWDKSKMPNKPQWVVLSTSVTKYWRGQAPNPCWILVSPNKLAPGNFTFRSRVRNGPRGWLQALDEKSKFGFPLYRYWLDQR